MNSFPGAECVVEVDFAVEMLRENARKFADRRVSRVCADALRLPAASGAFDLVLCFGILPHLGDGAGRAGRVPAGAEARRGAVGGAPGGEPRVECLSRLARRPGFIGRAASVGPTGARSGRGRGDSDSGRGGSRLVLRTRGKARRLTRRLLPLAPILLFAGMLALMQWVAGMPVTWLWLKTILVSLATMAVVRFLPWDRWLFRLRAGSFLFQTGAVRVVRPALRLRAAGGGTARTHRALAQRAA